MNEITNELGIYLIYIKFQRKKIPINKHFMI